MIFAELQRKLGSNFARAHDRAEDLFTSSVFQLLRYLTLPHGVAPFLSRARRVDVGGAVATGKLELGEIDRAELEFWPRFRTYGEPDLLVRLYWRDRMTRIILVEAKLHSPKSGERGSSGDDGRRGEPEADAEPFEPDQLARYWRGLLLRPEVAAGAKPTLIYLTAHATPPLEELHASLERGPQAGMSLYWLSWREAWNVAMDARRSPGDSLVARDLCALLAHKGMKPFEGFQRAELFSPFPKGGFRSRTWFGERLHPDAKAAEVFAKRNGFWRGGE